MENHPDGIKIEANEQYSGNLLGLDGAHASVATPVSTPVGTPLSGSSMSSPLAGTYRSSGSKQRWNESPEARARRLARNAERMRERRSRESEDEYRRRLARNAEANRVRRQNESDVERAMRLVRNAARQRLRRAMESPEQRSKRLSKLAERMRIYRANETPEQRKERLAEMAARARERISRESSEERRDRLRKLSEYAKKVRLTKNSLKQENSIIINQNQNSVQTSQGQPETTSIPQQLTPQSQLQSDHQQQQQNYVQQTLTNSIEYYQNMFIQSALRPNLIKENHQHLHPHQQQSQQQQQQQHQQTQQQPQSPPVRFSQNNQNITMDSNSASPSLFQQNLYDNSKSIQKFHHSPYQTLTNTIEYYQNKFIKGAKSPQSQDTQSTSKDNINLAEGFHTSKDMEEDRERKEDQTPPFTTQQQVQNPPAALYNQFPYLNNFSGMTATSPPVPNQQNYYPMYHNGFQLAITPNSVPPPFTPVHFQNSSAIQPQSHAYTLLNSTQNQQLVQDFPKPVRGRPKKIFPDNEITRIPSELQEEAIRQQKVNALLENEISQILASPKRCRGRPGRGQETEEERRIRVDKISAHQKRSRANETSEERAIRLKNLSERARMKRAQIRATENEEQRRQRLAKQAQYARQRRLRAQTPEHKRRMEEKAKELYAQLHNLPPPPAQQQHQQHQQNQVNGSQHQQQHQQQQMTAHGTTIISSDEFVKNSAKDFTQSENDVLKILEPIIVMKAK